MSKSLLDDVFKKPEPEVRTFSEAMRTPTNDRGEAPRFKGSVPDGDWRGRAMSGKKDRIEAAVYSRQQQGAVVIEHGWDGTDYVWHFSPDPRRRWKVSVDRVIYAIAKTMHKTIPDRVKVNIFLPIADWDVKIITFKAHGLGDSWNVTRKSVEDLTLRLFETLNTLV